ncbi:MAG: hypothetical protein JNK76_25895 [Planctomycetales bacterium]|jgi:hypothetical protein|nr:hypothetical protein [Planctomycetales bacterium]
MKANTMNPHDGQFGPLEIGTFVFVTSSFAGLTRALAGGKELTLRMVAAAMLSAGFFSLGMWLVFADFVAGSPRALVGMCILSGIGGQTATEFFWTAAKNVFEAMIKAKTGGGSR